VQESEAITSLLLQWRAGRSDAGHVLQERIYDELKRMARARIRSDGAPPTLNATALVHEAVSRLLGNDADWQSRSHFFALAALQMKSVLIDHARRHSAEKRGGDWQRVTLGDEAVALDDDERLLALSAALERLAAAEPRAAQVIELTYFGGMPAADIAAHLGIGVRTAERDLGFARAWLKRELAA
jgi:RNA polymerase sigma factor (TIGR02999 family)